MPTTRRATWLSLQLTESLSIERLLRIFKKENAPPKTEEYLEETSKTLIQLWSSFDERHRLILGEDLMRESEYIKENLHGRVQQYYDELTLAIMKERVKLACASLRPGAETASQSGNEPERHPSEQEPVPGTSSAAVFDRERTRIDDNGLSAISEFIEYCESEDIEEEEWVDLLFEAQRLFDVFRKSHNIRLTSTTVPEERSQLQRDFFGVQRQYQKFLRHHQREQSTRLPSQVPTFEENDRESVPFGVHSPPITDQDTVAAFFRSIVDGVNQIHIQKSSSEIKLPKVELPQFTGDRDEWPEFYDMFTSNIHNKPNLSNSSKMGYLKSLVKNDAATSISQFTNTGENYESAWKVLYDRYHQPKMMKMHKLSMLFKIKPVEHDIAAQLKAFIDSTKGILYSLRNLNEPVDEWNSIVVFFITQRLPLDTLGLWEQSCADSKKCHSCKTCSIFWNCELWH